VLLSLLHLLLTALALAAPGGAGPLVEVLTPRLAVPALDINAPLTRFPLGDGSWAIDPWEARPGHFVYTAWLDEPGNMVVGGHVEYPDGGRGVFADLSALKIGNSVQMRVGARTWTYRVVEIRTVAHDDLSVLYPSERPRLTLITCDEPSFDPSTGLYDQRLVVVAEQVADVADAP
jgi:LPXTG-site transpeptidase (sortase) family protein